MTHSPLKNAVRSYAATYEVSYLTARTILQELASAGRFSLHWFKRRLADNSEPVWPPLYSPGTYRAVIAKSEHGIPGRTVAPVSGNHASPRPNAHESESLRDIAGWSLGDLRADPRFDLTAFREILLKQIERPRINL